MALGPHTLTMAAADPPTAHTSQAKKKKKMGGGGKGAKGKISPSKALPFYTRTEDFPENSTNISGIRRELYEPPLAARMAGKFSIP